MVLGVSLQASMIQNLQKEPNQLRKSTDVAQVDNAIASLQQWVTKLAGLFDPYIVMSALEQVVGVTMEKRDNRAERCGIISETGQAFDR